MDVPPKFPIWRSLSPDAFRVFLPSGRTAGESGILGLRASFDEEVWLSEFF